MQPKNMQELFRSLDKTSSSQPAEQPGQPGQPGQTPTVEQPKSMQELFRSIGSMPSTQDQGTAKESAIEDPNAWKKEARAGHFERVSMRAAEALGGMPGEIIQGTNAILAKLASKGIKAATGKEVSEEELAGEPGILPTSEDIKKFHEKYTGEYYRPQTAGQAKADELVQDLVRIGAPIGTSKASATYKILKTLGVVGGGEAAAKTAEALGYDKEIQGYTKMIAQNVLNLLNPGLGKAIKSAHYGEVDRLPPTYKGNASTLKRDLRKEMQWAESLGDTADKTFIRNELKPLLEKLDKNPRLPTLSFQDGREFIRALNKNSENIYKLPPGYRGTVKGKIASIKKSFEPFFKQADKHQPGWSENLKIGDEIHHAVESSKGLSKFIKRNKDVLIKSGVGGAFLDTVAGVPLIKPAAIAGAAGIALHQPGKVLWQMYKSPTLRRAYAKAALSSEAGSIPQVAAYLKKAEKESKREER